jgi:hypothetical protein
VRDVRRCGVREACPAGGAARTLKDKHDRHRIEDDLVGARTAREREAGPCPGQCGHKDGSHAPHAEEHDRRDDSPEQQQRLSAEARGPVLVESLQHTQYSAVRSVRRVDECSGESACWMT